MNRTVAGLLCVLAAAAAAAQAPPLQTIEHEGVARIVIQNGGIFEVSIKGTSGAAVRVEVRSSDPQDKVRDSRSGDELTIAADRRDRVRSIGSKPPEMSLRVPEGTALSVETSSGNIVVETVNGAKSLLSSTGNITVRSSRGAVDARSSTGNQRYDYLNGDVRAQSSTGAIELTNVEGRAELESSTGRLWGRALRITGDSRFRTSTGRIEMDFANPLEDFTFSVQSVTGLIDIGGAEARGRVQKGGGPLRITAQTTTGRQTYR